MVLSTPASESARGVNQEMGDLIFEGATAKGWYA
jgi:hypothetical protein